jgi:hypothetical protein
MGKEVREPIAQGCQVAVPWSSRSWLTLLERLIGCPLPASHIRVTHWGVVLSCRRFFQTACDVPELQDKFNVDEYSDLVTLTKPVIYISIGEIINTHTVSTLL